MLTTSLSLHEIYDLAKKTLLFNGCDEENASILSDTIMRAERDGSLSHGLFRLPAYVASLKSKKVNGKARPEIKKISLNASKLVNADYAGIDLIKDKYENFKVIEINSIPAWKALQKVTNKNIAYILAKTFVTKLK